MARLTNMNEREKKYAMWKQDERGLKMAAIFKDLANSSTRCETAALLLGMMPRLPTRVAIDNTTTVHFTKRIIDHEKQTEKWKNGALKIARSWQNSRKRNASRKPWPLVKKATYGAKCKMRLGAKLTVR